MTSFDPGALGRKPYAMVGPDGWDYIGLHYDESEVWQIALGWPSPVEIIEHKAHGVFVTEITCAYPSEKK